MGNSNIAEKVLITGASGMLGQDLCPILEDNGYEIIETNSKNLDITNFKKVEQFINSEQPAIIINCAAYTNVDKAEEEFEIARKINALSVENLAKVCSENNILLIHISTDYIFDGEKQEPYVPSDITNPVNAYGKTKLEGELAIQKYCKKYYIVRTSWLYGIHGKNFIETMISLKDKPELKVVDDQIGCPTWTVELSDGIVKLLEEKKEYGIYHICSSGKTSWYNLAKEIFKSIGAQVNLKPCTTEEFPTPAKRPKNSVMDNQKICRNWKSALKDYLMLRSE